MKLCPQLLFACSLIACSQAAIDPDAVDESDVLARGKTIECVPVDGEACSDESCVDKLVLTSTGGNIVSLEIERSEVEAEIALPSVKRPQSTSFRFGSRNLKGTWQATESLDAQSTDGKVYVGIAKVDGVGSFMVECRRPGTPTPPAYVRTATRGQNCNCPNESGITVRCVKSSFCGDEDGREIPLTSHAEGSCQQHVLKTAALGEACNVNPAGTQNRVLCKVGLHCRDGADQEIPLAQSDAAGTCK